MTTCECGADKWKKDWVLLYAQCLNCNKKYSLSKIKKKTSK